ncbi:AAA family ATPase [Leptolyngbya sp. AN02str]|uniref:bifunctional aminoglycoside phosphotransferase/ATP-binding protein n=1 Tax=Leptolyngbya sp. AN02str TaxID=3423363 RepID=UPI003D322BBD
MTDAQLPLLIQQMTNPDFYPHPVYASPHTLEDSANREYPEEFYPLPRDPVQLIQTHVSYVFLTGEFAYKLKKPVNFGFLDYTTLEQRLHFCQEELRLNQRAAADLYLEVVPISQMEDSETGEPRFQLGDAGTIVDYAVKMRQFPQDTLLTDLYEQGKVTEELVQELARVIAKFHQVTDTDDRIRNFGRVEQVRQAFDENFAQTQHYIGGPQTQQQFDETQAYCDRFFDEQQDLFQQRMEQDRIRECHGDLHLRNIAYWNDKLWLFDCIEFNEPFRFVDVMYDVAYLVMDFDIRQRQDLTALFLNTYTEETGDWDGLQVLPIYVNRQTYVRAKVTSFLLDDPNVSASDKQAAQETAASYYRMAWEYTQPKAGKLMIMAGLSGAGKSTIARKLAKKLGAIHIRSDAVRKHLGGVPLYERGGDELYTPAMTQKTYGRLLELGTRLAANGYTVILDAKYNRQALRAEAIAQAQAHNISLQFIHCTAPAEELQRRVQQRTGDIADADLAVLLQQTFEPFTDAEVPYMLRIDTSQNVDHQLSML